MKLSLYKLIKIIITESYVKVSETKNIDTDDIEFFFDCDFKGFRYSFRFFKRKLKTKELTKIIKEILFKRKDFINFFRQEISIYETALSRPFGLYTTSITDQGIIVDNNRHLLKHNDVRWLIIDSYKNFWLYV